MIIRSLREKGFKNKIIANELREEERENLTELANEVYIGDFLKWEEVDETIGTVFTNPPFSLAQEFIEQSIQLFPNATIIMLQRVNFMGSQKRHQFWQKHAINGIYVLSNRPKFINGKTDACEYCWYVIDRTDKQVIKVIW